MVSLVGLAVTGVDISARRFMFSAQQDAGVQSEASPAMEHIVNNVKYGWNLSTSCGGADICFSRDTDVSDGIGPFGNVTAQTAQYRYQSGTEQLQFRPNASGTWETIAQHITACTFTLQDTNGDGANDRLTIRITSQTTSSSAGTKTITLQSDVALRFAGYKIL